jgi:ent-kaurene oxidase
MLVARMSARIFLGEPACRDPEWLRVSIAFTMDAFTTAFILRMFPTPVRFIVARFLPSRYRLKRHRAKAAEVVGAKMERHRKAKERRERGEPVDDEDTLMDWMLENGRADFLFELCAHPEWISVLRDEIFKVKQGTGDADRKDIKQWLSRLERMDSFLLECFRLHPPIICKQTAHHAFRSSKFICANSIPVSPQRVALQSYTLKDGTHIPKGCRIAFANSEHQIDPEVTPNPSTFDPMRSYRKRHTSEDQYDRNQAALTDINNNLTFGYGNQACPGRFLGVGEVKMLVSRLLTEFDFKYPEGKSIPTTMCADENVFMDPSARLLMKQRKHI